ncbi:MAG: protein kinase [Verrucomicrobia bacterium]|nr:protein kinase [Verrucomicrobiota bacterium]
MPELCPLCLIELAQRLPPPDPSADLPTEFGDYQLLDKINEGGMGVVYRARQRRLNRLVALKMIRTGRAATEHDLRRFRTEAAAAANLDHPNILPVFEIDEHAGQLFYSMKLVEGDTLAGQIQQGRWLPAAGNAAVRQRQLADLMGRIALAVHHAHERGVLHRDLKPANILIDVRGTPYVMDFGLAKFIDDDTPRTHSSVVLGTLGYAAPEQIAGPPQPVTCRVDLYGLGAILYALLTGHAPVAPGPPFLMLRRALESDPVPPRRLNPVVDVDLETLCLKCLDKDPHRRYATARELADDLARWRRDEPITARTAGPGERAWKWVRRHHALVWGGAAAGLTLVLGLGGLLWERALSGHRDVFNHMQRAEALFAQDDVPLATATLARLVRAQPGRRVVVERLANALARHRYLVPIRPKLPAGAHLARWSADGGRLLLARRDGERELLEILDARGQPEASLQPAPAGVHAADISPDGRWVAVAADRCVRVWDTHVSALAPLLDRSSPTGLIRQVQLLPDRRVLVLAGDRIVQWPLSAQSAPREFAGTTSLLTRMAVAPARDWLAAATDTGALRVWRLTTGEPVRSWAAAHARVIRDLRFDPEGLRLASASADLSARVWDPGSGRMVAECRHDQGVHTIEFSPDGSRLVTGSRDRTARLWDAGTGQPLGRPMRHADCVNTARFSSDGGCVVTAADDGAVRLWEGASGVPLSAAAQWSAPVTDAVFRPGTRIVLVRQAGGDVELRAPTPSQCLGSGETLVPAPAPSALSALEQAALERLHGGVLAFVEGSPDGRLVAGASSNDTAVLLLRHAGSRVGPPLQHAAPVNCARFSPDGLRLVTSSADRSFRVWDTQRGVALTDPIPAGEPVAGVRFDQCGGCVITDRGRAWSIAQAHAPAPGWLADLAEAVAGVRLDAQGAPEPVPAAAFESLAAALAADPGPLAAWLRPFLDPTRNAPGGPRFASP